MVTNITAVSGRMGRFGVQLAAIFAVAGMLLIMHAETTAGQAYAQSLVDQLRKRLENEIGKSITGKSKNNRNKNRKGPSPINDSRVLSDVQRALSDLGLYGDNIDGKWGNNSRSAYSRWQASNNFRPNGRPNYNQISILYDQARRAAEARANKQGQQSLPDVIAAGTNYRIVADNLGRSNVRQITIQCDSGVRHSLYQMDDRVWRSDFGGDQNKFHFVATARCLG